MFTYERIRGLVQFGLGPELESIRIRPGLLPDVQDLQRLPDAVPGAVAVSHVDGLQLRKISHFKQIVSGDQTERLSFTVQYKP
jgi:hypothetical protein